MKKKPTHYEFFRKRRSRTIRALNNVWVLNGLMTRGLESVKKEVKAAPERKLKFEVPSSTGEKIVATRKRSRILRELDNAENRGLNEQSLVVSVALTEDYLQWSLRHILRWFPHKLTTNAAGDRFDRKVSIDAILKSKSREDLISRQIDKFILAIVYDSPGTYLKRIEKVLSIEISQRLKDEYAEIKATRDVMVHNSGIANERYGEKAGKLARAQPDESLPVDSEYSSHVIIHLKKLTQRVYQQLLGKYGNAKLPIGFPDKPNP